MGWHTLSRVNTVWLKQKSKINSWGTPPSSLLTRRRRGLVRSCHTLVRVNTVWLNNNNDKHFPIRLQDPYVDVIIVTANYPDGKFALIYPFAEKDFDPPIGNERFTASVHLANSPQLITPNTTQLTEIKQCAFLDLWERRGSHEGLSQGHLGQRVPGHGEFRHRREEYCLDIPSDRERWHAGGSYYTWCRGHLHHSKDIWCSILDFDETSRTSISL